MTTLLPDNKAKATLRVTVVVPVRDGAAMVAECVPRLSGAESAARRGHRRGQRVARRDRGGGPDRRRHGPRRAGRGSYRARNRGWRSTDSEIIAFTDGDCVPDRDWLANLMGPFSDPSVAAVGGAIVPDELKSAPQRWMVERRFLDQAQNADHEFLPFFATASVAYRRSVLVALDGFDESYFSGGDCDMSWRVQALSAGRLVYRPNAEVRHHVGESLSEVTQRWYRYEAEHILLKRRWSQWPGYPPSQRFFARTKRVWQLPLSLGKRLLTGRPLSVPLIDVAAAISRERGRLRGRIDARTSTVAPLVWPDDASPDRGRAEVARDAALR